MDWMAWGLLVVVVVARALGPKDPDSIASITAEHREWIREKRKLEYVINN